MTSFLQFQSKKSDICLCFFFLIGSIKVWLETTVEHIKIDQKLDNSAFIALRKRADSVSLFQTVTAAFFIQKSRYTRMPPDSLLQNS